MHISSNNVQNYQKIYILFNTGSLIILLAFHYFAKLEIQNTDELAVTKLILKHPKKTFKKTTLLPWTKNTTSQLKL